MLHFTDARSNANDQIAHAAKQLRKSRYKTAVFRAMYFGKKREKTADEIAKAARMPRKRVLEEAAKLAHQRILTKRRDREHGVIYERDDFYQINKGKILALAGNPDKLRRFPTKTNPGGGPTSSITLRLPKSQVKVKHITIDDVDSFSKVKRVAASAPTLKGMSESDFKDGVRRVIGEPGTFTDWGGEKRDLLTTRLLYRGKRYRGAFAFKGPGKGGSLTPAKMGKNGDQLSRLFETKADVYFVQHWNQIEDSVRELMEKVALATSFLEHREIIFGLIDGADSVRLVEAYPKQFDTKSNTKSKRGTKRGHQAKRK